MTAGKENTLPQEIAWKIERADGFLDLRMPARARAEMEKIPPEYRDHVAYHALEMRLYLEEHRWADAAALARRLRDDRPDEPAYWVQLAYALRRAQSIESARSILLEAHERFSDVAVIPYNLACYECQLGDLPRARAYLEKAFRLDPDFRKLAVRDEDLHPLWGELES